MNDYARTTYERMVKRGLSQRELAQAAGIDRETVSLILRGVLSPTSDQISRIDTALTADTR